MIPDVITPQIPIFVLLLLPIDDEVLGPIWIDFEIKKKIYFFAFSF